MGREMKKAPKLRVGRVDWVAHQFLSGKGFATLGKLQPRAHTVTVLRSMFGGPDFISQKDAPAYIYGLIESGQIPCDDVSRLFQRGQSKKTKTKTGATVKRRLSKAQFDAFYKTKEWRVLRYKAILKYGRKCMACGDETSTIHVDHIKPRYSFPDLELDINNLQILCEDCNMGKGGWDRTDWREAAP